MIPSGYKTTADILREITEKERLQEGLREQIEYLPEGHPERERKINWLFQLHEEITELAAIAHTI